MIKVFFDNKVFFEQPLGGASKYINELSKSLSVLNCDSEILSPIHINNYLDKNQSAKTIYKFDNHYPRFTRLIFEKFNKYYIKKYIKNNKPNILHFTDINNDYLDIFLGKKIVTVYDLIHEKFENLYNLPNDYKVKKKFFLEEMDHIICISENTKKDLIDIYNIKESKISVIYLGVSSLKEKKNKKIDQKRPKPYLLYVGYRKRYKNFLRFLKAFSLSKNLVNDFDIVCFGNQKFDKEELITIDQLKLKQNIQLVSGNDDDLNFYYRNAELFIFPSLYEGFGIPLLEAMQNGCPVCCSETSSLREIGADAVDFFLPENEESILNSLNKVLYSNDYKLQLIKNGFKNVSQYTWLNCAKKTLEQYKKIND